MNDCKDCKWWFGCPLLKRQKFISGNSDTCPDWSRLQTEGMGSGWT